VSKFDKKGPHTRENFSRLGRFVAISRGWPGNAGHDLERKETGWMSQQNRKDRIDQSWPTWAGQSEPESHTEHQAALDATLFQASGDYQELVFELERGELRIRKPHGL
jgi:hypothetical protein